MPYTSPRTWVALETVTASIMNVHVRDNLIDLDGRLAGTVAYNFLLNGSVEILEGLIVGFNGTPSADTIQIGDANFSLSYNSGNPLFTCDTNDSFYYDRATNDFNWVIGSATEMRLGAAGLGLTNGLTVGFLGTPTDDAVQVGDTLLGVFYDASSPTLRFDTNDWLRYTRGTNEFAFVIGAADYVTLTTAALVANTAVTVTAGALTVGTSTNSAGSRAVIAPVLNNGDTTDILTLAAVKSSSPNGQLRLRATRGTWGGTLAAVASGDNLFSIAFEGNTGAGGAWTQAATIVGVVDGTVASGDVPGRLEFWTQVAAGALARRMHIDNAGDIFAGAPAAMALGATTGFLRVRSMAGSPSGAPTISDAECPVVIDSSNLRIYVRVGGNWRYAALT